MTNTQVAICLILASFHGILAVQHEAHVSPHEPGLMRKEPEHGGAELLQIEAGVSQEAETSAAYVVSSGSEHRSAVSTLSEYVKDVQEFWHKNINIDNMGWSTWIFSGVQLVVCLSFTYLYKKHVVDQILPLQPLEAGSRGKDFSRSLCDCLGHPQLCWYAICCLPCRAAHTWNVAGVLDYLLGVFSYTLCTFVGCWWCIGAKMRMDMRRKLGMEEDTCCDFIAWFCCPLCAAGQEALEVDELSRVDVACCFKLTRLNEQGQPLLDPVPSVPPQPQAEAAAAGQEATQEAAVADAQPEQNAAGAAEAESAAQGTDAAGETQPASS